MSTEIHPLTSERWRDLEKLFGPRGAYGGCWCMYWRIARSEFKERQGERNRRELRRIVDEGEVPGVLAYRDGEPVGWCSIAPRAEFASLNRSRTLKPLDDRPVWSIVCFFVAPRHRGEGLVAELIEGAVEWARSQGATLIEGYPTVPRSRTLPPVSSYMGLPAHFERAGFTEAARPSAAKAVMR
ncbi:MAG TPA: GNAT family N-acetyltransferase, partial [Thermoanaerobaculia bacterium]|nr:GNAT family N-acetyltransferase [Thermoanaerobaculia bacterium]